MIQKENIKEEDTFSLDSRLFVKLHRGTEKMIDT